MRKVLHLPIKFARRIKAQPNVLMKMFGIAEKQIMGGPKCPSDVMALIRRMKKCQLQREFDWGEAWGLEAW